MRNIILGAFAALVAAAAVPATAAEPASRTISYADLDLATAHGRATLDRRIAAAVEALCGSYAGAPGWAVPEIDRCRAAARTSAETQLAALARRGGRIVIGSR